MCDVYKVFSDKLSHGKYAQIKNVRNFSDDVCDGNFYSISW